MKSKALRGWTKCSDGRLYHRVVAEKALEAWIEKLGQRKSSGAGNAKRWGGEFDAAPIDAAINHAAQMLAALNPQSRTLQKRTARTANGNANGNPGGTPDSNPEIVPSGSQETGTQTGTNKKKEDAADAARDEGSNQPVPSPVVPFPRNGATGEGQSAPGMLTPSQPRSDRDWLWTNGLTWLSKATGRAETGLRSQLGKWLKTLKDDSTGLRSAFEAARDSDVAEPIAWITKAVEARVKAVDPFAPTDEHGWRKRFALYKENPVWPASWGGKCPGDHPGHPPALLAEFGFQTQAGRTQ